MTNERYKEMKNMLREEESNIQNFLYEYQTLLSENHKKQREVTKLYILENDNFPYEIGRKYDVTKTTKYRKHSYTIEQYDKVELLDISCYEANVNSICLIFEDNLRILCDSHGYIKDTNATYTINESTYNDERTN